MDGEEEEKEMEGKERGEYGDGRKQEEEKEREELSGGYFFF